MQRPDAGVDVDRVLDSFPQRDKPYYVLDVGCEDGRRLEAAARRGWKCFGIEADAALRARAIGNHAAHAEIVAEVSELIPHAFDLILMIDVVEQVADPYAWMFHLFNAGAIGPETRLFITALDGERATAAQAARLDCSHAPLDLVHHTGRSIRQWLSTLHFAHIDVQPIDAVEPRLRCEASGSDFYAFMLERYVPGTWSKLAEYEHVPRYQFARQFAHRARVLDFGCGTGYGARFLADRADDVLGLDIDADGLAWASFWHQTPGLRFERHDDLGATLPSASFDLVTCFEMIEHVDHATQMATVESLARVVTPGGKLLISTPNPAVTANYGANPYHLREMSESEFVALLTPHFEHVAIYRQWIRPSIMIGTEPIPSGMALASDRLSDDSVIDEPPAFIAVCSHAPIADIAPFCTFDSSFDMVLAETQLQKRLTSLRFDRYLLRESDDERRRQVDALKSQVASIDGTRVSFAAQEAALQIALDEQAVTIAGMRASFAEQEANIDRLRGELSAAHTARDEASERAATLAHDNTRHVTALGQQELAIVELRQDAVALAEALARERAQVASIEALLHQRTAEKDEWARHYAALENTRFVRLARILHGNSGSRAPFLEGVYLVAGGLVPTRLKSKLAPVAASLRGRFAKRPPASEAFAPYVIRQPAQILASRPRVLHVIANFMTGGSSRLVVDLLEHLGGEYEQHILTSFIPSPPNYVGANITEVRPIGDTEAMRALVTRFDPHIVHVHYWGDVDEPWYRAVFKVVEERGCPILQNINTPVAPFADAARLRNVFVSRYVLDHFGDGQRHNSVIYPGSDFTLFAPARRPRRAYGCIGMVYRLERDKLDETAIEPFIEAARAMPGLKCLIVGGGSLMQPFKDRVHAEGLDDAFEFTGYVSYESLPALYRRMDVFVAPIWKESFGQVSAFAMNMGIPVVGYDVGAIPEIVADPSLVAPARDARALADIAIGLVRDDAARESIGVANRQRAARMFSIDAMIGSYRELYRDLLKQ